MTENKGDLISREALKKDFKDRLEKAKNWKENALNNGDEELVIRADATIDFICEVIMTINNAPTVDIQSTIKRDVWELYERYRPHLAVKVYEFGEELKELLNRYGIDERPQGKWIEYKEDNEIRYYCSNCHVTKGQAVNNFCACCGADMRGKEE